MAELKKYDVKTGGGYATTLRLSDEDAKVRGLLGKDIESVARLKAEAVEAAEKEAADKAAAEAAATEAAEKEAAEKAAQAPQNKQARPAGNK